MLGRIRSLPPLLLVQLLRPLRLLTFLPPCTDRLVPGWSIVWAAIRGRGRFRIWNYRLLGECRTDLASGNGGQSILLSAISTSLTGLQRIVPRSSPRFPYCLAEIASEDPSDHSPVNHGVSPSQRSWCVHIELDPRES
jgi:hypothetical protein